MGEAKNPWGGRGAKDLLQGERCSTLRLMLNSCSRCKFWCLDISLKNLTGVQLWIKAYLLTERNAVGNRTLKYVLVLFKGMAHIGGLAALQRQLHGANQWHSQATAPSKGIPCFSKNPKEDKCETFQELLVVCKI